MSSTRDKARFAGMLYLLMMITAPIGLLYVPGRLIVSGDPAATAEHIRSSEFLFRIGMATELFHQALAVFLVLALYRLFKPVHEDLSRHLVALGALVSVPIMFVNVLCEVIALQLIHGAPFLSVFDTAERESLAYLFLRMHTEGIQLASVFWGLWLFPFGLLVIRSGFIPRFLGILLLIAGVGYLTSATVSVLLPQHASAVGRIALLLETTEVPIIFWLAIWGATEKRGAAPELRVEPVAPAVRR